MSNTQVDDSILSELHQKFGLNTEQDDQLDAVWEKATKEEDRVDVDTSQAEKRTKKKMNANSSKVASAPQRPPPTLVAPKGTGVMAHVSKKETPKKPQPSSTAKHLRALSETNTDEDGFEFRKRKVAPPSIENNVTQVKKVKPTPKVLPSLTQPRTRK